MGPCVTHCVSVTPVTSTCAVVAGIIEFSVAKGETSHVQHTLDFSVC